MRSEDCRSKRPRRPRSKKWGWKRLLGVQLTDPETQTPGGMLIVGFAGAARLEAK